MNDEDSKKDKLMQAQNPFLSCFVQASAGSGKTYQLSHRFFNLVMAGNDPASILCLTFSKAAVAEMHERILRLSHDFLRSKDLQDEQSKLFKSFIDSSKNLKNQNMNFRSPREAAERILSRSGSLKITTIDSLAWEWVRRFSTELRLFSLDTSSNKNLKIETSDRLEKEQSKILFSCIRILLESETFSNYSWIQKKFKEQGYLSFAKTLEKLIKGFRPQCEHILFVTGSIANAFKLWDFEHEFANETELENHYATPCIEILRPVLADLDDKKSSYLYKFLNEKKFDYLFQGKIFSKKELRISQTNRKLILEKYAENFQEAAKYLRKFDEQLQFFRLNQEIVFFASCVHLFLGQWEDYQKESLTLSFSDLAPKSARIFLDESLEHLRFILSQDVQHLLLDEFQDTSRLQWDIYQNLCQLILNRKEDAAFNRGSPPSIFLVGDSKQSIYAFRGADPSVSLDAKNFFEQNTLPCIKMNLSFRSSPRVLSYVNRLFTAKLQDFETHSSHESKDGSSMDPQVGNISILKASFDEFELSEDEKNKLGAEEQNMAIADSLANYVHLILKEQRELYPVWDKKENKWRSLQAKDCVVLYRWSTHASIYEQAFRNVGIPIHHIGNSFLKDHIVFKDCLSLLKAHVIKDDALSLVSVLQSPFYKISHHNILSALAKLRNKKENFNEENFVTKPFQASLLKELELFTPAEVDTFEKHNRVFSKHSYSSTFLYLWQELDLQSHYVKDFEENQRTSVLQMLIRFLEVLFELEKNSPGIQGVHLIHQLEEYATHVEVENSSTSVDGITMMTVHASKGLEFPFVIVCNIENEWSKEEGHWFTDPTDPYKICYQASTGQRPKFSDTFNTFSEQLEIQKNQDGLRSLYVALTRSKHHICLAYSGLEKSSTPITQSLLKALDSSKEHSFNFGLVHTDFGASTQALNQKIFQKENQKNGEVHTSKSSLTREIIWSKHEPMTDLDKYAGRVVLSSNQKNRIQAGDFESAGFKKILNEDEKQIYTGSDFGNLLHKCIEVQLKYHTIPFNPQKLEKIYHYVNSRKKLSFELDPNLFAVVSLSLKNLFSSDNWTRLTKNFSILKTELETQVLKDNELLNLKLDLLMLDSTGKSAIVDWKSGQLPETDLSDAELLQYCKTLSYEKQIHMYHHAIDRIYPVKECWIYFTRYHRWLEIRNFS